MNRYAGDKYESTVWQNAGNASQGKYVSGAYDEDGHFMITASEFGAEEPNVSPSIQYAQESYGVQETWDYLTNDCHAAHDPRIGDWITAEIDY